MILYKRVAIAGILGLAALGLVGSLVAGPMFAVILVGAAGVYWFVYLFLSD